MQQDMDSAMSMCTFCDPELPKSGLTVCSAGSVWIGGSGPVTFTDSGGAVALSFWVADRRDAVPDAV